MWRHWLPAGIFLFIPQLLSASTIFIDFERFVDGDVITIQIPGLTFANTTILSAGISLNEFDLPPHSGVSMVSDNGGRSASTSIDTPRPEFAAYFTFLEPLTLSAFGASNIQVGAAISLFSNNTGTAGVPGSSPNKLLQLSSLGLISSVSITGDPAGVRL